jgi:hypothetical protein
MDAPTSLQHTPASLLRSPMERTIDTVISAQGLAETAGIARIHDLSEQAKTSRARKAAGICVAIGAASLFIPLVHFVLPWVMLIVATVVYKKVSHQGAVLLEAVGPCPKCGETIIVGEQTLDWPVEWNCEGCRKSTTTTPVASSSGS